MIIRLLDEADAVQYHTMRLRALREHPEAFGISYEDEQATPLDVVAQRLHSSTPSNCVLGAYDEDRLLGTVGISQRSGPKTRHKAMLWGMYVAPENRGSGTGKALLGAAIRHAYTVPYLEELTLAVTAGNATSRALYIRTGFEPYCIEPRYIKLGSRYYDIEWMFLRLHIVEG